MKSKKSLMIKEIDKRDLLIEDLIKENKELYDGRVVLMVLSGLTGFGFGILTSLMI